MAVPTDNQQNLVQQLKSTGAISQEDQQILDELQIFKSDSENIRRYPAIAKLVEKEANRISKGLKCSEEEKFIDLESGKTTRMTFKVLLPVEKYPQFNYVGRILGPKGATLRGMQEISGCKMAVLGKGSMRDKVKEDKCRQEGGKFAHLNEPLQIWMQAFGTPDEIFYKLHIACKEVKKYLQADYNDDIFTEQMALLEQMGGCHPRAFAYSETPLYSECNQTRLQSSTSATLGHSARGAFRGIHGHRDGYSPSDRSRFGPAGNIGRSRPLEHALRGTLRGNLRGRGRGHNHLPRTTSATAIGMQQPQTINQRMDCDNYYEEMYENFHGIPPYQNGIENGRTVLHYETPRVVRPRESRIMHLPRDGITRVN